MIDFKPAVRFLKTLPGKCAEVSKNIAAAAKNYRSLTTGTAAIVGMVYLISGLIIDGFANTQTSTAVKISADAISLGVDLGLTIAFGRVMNDTGRHIRLTDKLDRLIHGSPSPQPYSG